MNINAYVNFNGNCEEALKFYEKVLGAKIEMLSTFEGSPAAAMAPANWQTKIVHARFRIGDTVVMASDGPPGRYDQPKGISLSLGVDTPADAERVFGGLAEKGTITMPLAQSFFASRFGMVTDRFGIPWMVVCEAQA
ncbi:MAG: VOC family protein [Rhizomicrobium sp.]|jgi:PhnB protein